MKKTPTASDVARLAEVSRSAVSLVLSGNGAKARISEETQQRIRKAAEQLNYYPNAAGRSLVYGRAETIALVIRDIGLLSVDPFVPPFLSGILQATRDKGYRVLVESAHGADGDDPFGGLMDSGRIDGMIVENPDYGDTSLRRLIKSGRPVVVMGSQGLAEEYSVGHDNYRIGYLATEHLASIGRTRIAHVAFSRKGIYAVDNRISGYRDALRAAGLAVNPELTVHADFSTESGYRAMAQLLETTPRPDAIFAGSDAVAIGVSRGGKGLRASCSRGYRDCKRRQHQRVEPRPAIFDDGDERASVLRSTGRRNVDRLDVGTRPEDQERSDQLPAHRSRVYGDARQMSASIPLTRWAAGTVRSVRANTGSVS